MTVRYEISWHNTGDGMFNRCSVHPIKVLQELSSNGHPIIIAIDEDGNKFQGSPEDFYATEVEAWAAVKTGIMDSIEANTESIKERAKENEDMQRFLDQNLERFEEWK